MNSTFESCDLKLSLLKNNDKRNTTTDMISRIPIPIKTHDIFLSIPQTLLFNKHIIDTNNITKAITDINGTNTQQQTFVLRLPNIIFIELYISFFLYFIYLFIYSGYL